MTSSPQNSDSPNTANGVPYCELHRREKSPAFTAGSPLSKVLPYEALWVCDVCAEKAISNQAAADHAARDVATRTEQQSRKQEEVERRIGAAGIPARYSALSFDTYPITNERARTLVSILRSYSNRFPQMSARGVGVLLTGTAGTGKTGLACCIANTIIREHKSTALFMTSYAAVRHLRDTWGRRGKTEKEALDDLLLPDLLILDEIGTSVGGESELASLFEILNGRYAAQRSTILLANLPIDDYEAAGLKRPGLRSFLGPRILDRFQDDGSFSRVLDWPSLRGQKHGE